MKIFKQIESYKKRIAIESNGKQFTYAYLIEKSDLIASFLLNEKKDLKEEKIGLLMNADIDYICTLWGIWKAGGVAVPLSLSAKQDELKHYISDCDIFEKSGPPSPAAQSFLTQGKMVTWSHAARAH